MSKHIEHLSNPDVDRFDRWAATYDRSLMQRLFFGPVHNRMLDFIVQAGPQEPPCCILDVGCGTGRLLHDASARWPKAKFYGVDPAEHMAFKARRLNPMAAIQVAPAEAIPFPDQTADLVLSSISFHHWADHAKAVKEIARVLKPGGFFCLADHYFLLTKLLGEKVKSKSEIRSLMENAGLTVQGHRGMGIRFVLITLAQKPQ
jgi:ubiquinone/menaquinone biosynthesis C-methylase UbiE